MNEREKAIEAFKNIGDATYSTFVTDLDGYSDSYSNPVFDKNDEDIATVRGYLSKPSFDDAMNVVKEEIARETRIIEKYKEEDAGVRLKINEAYRSAFEYLLAKMKGMQ